MMYARSLTVAASFTLIAASVNAQASVPALKDVGVLNHGVYRAYDLIEGRIQ